VASSPSFRYAEHEISAYRKQDTPASRQRQAVSAAARAQQAALGATRVFLQRLLADDGPPLASLGR